MEVDRRAVLAPERDEAGFERDEDAVFERDEDAFDREDDERDDALERDRDVVARPLDERRWAAGISSVATALPS